MDRALSSLQVAALLVSASYGIGFLFGSGEMALTHGMGSSIYGLATAIGMLMLMLMLTLFAARLWRGGMAVWDLFGQSYGATVKNSVALAAQKL
jgi:solute:Na+ symporter, SSS family